MVAQWVELSAEAWAATRVAHWVVQMVARRAAQRADSLVPAKVGSSAACLAEMTADCWAMS